jgi:hypothetical protein
LKYADDNEALLARYLLGQLSAPEQERIEQDYVADAGLQERLDLVEDDLIDGYVRGRLAAADRAAFEEHFLNSPRRRERLAFARAWQQFVSALPPSLPATPHPAVTAARRPSRGPVVWLLAAMLLLAVGSLWLIVETARLRRELARSQAERAALAQSEAESRQQADDERARREALARQLAEPPPQVPGGAGLPPQSPAAVTFMLTTGAARGPGERQTLNLARAAGQVRLQLLFRESGATAPNQADYRAVLRTPEGREVLRRDGLRAQPKGAARMVVLPAGNLAGGDYILTLERRTGENDYEAVAEYAFTVSRK